MFGSSTYDYFTHPFKVTANHVTTVDGLLLGYTAKLQKRTYVKFDMFVGTNLDTTYINDLEVDMDTKYNYGANAKFIFPSGKLIFGIYSSANGKDLVINDIHQGIEDTQLFYQANVGFKYETPL